MLSFCWNIRRIKDLFKQHLFKYWCQIHRPLFVCLLETHVQEPNVSGILNSILPGWRLQANYEHSPLGKLWVVWDHLVSLIVYKVSLQMITCRVSLRNGRYNFTVSFIYVANLWEERSILWRELTDLSATSPLASSPWLVFSDFNQTISSHEHSNGDDYEESSAGSSELSDCLASSVLLDLLPFQGPLFTLWNHQ